MFRIAYQFINPTQKRARELSKDYNLGKEISESVPEVSEEDDEKILVLLCLKERMIISHICWGRRGNKAGTKLSRLHLERISEIKPIDTIELIKKEEWSSYDKYFPARSTFEGAEECKNFIEKIKSNFEEINQYIRESEEDYELIDNLSPKEHEIVHLEQDATEMAIRMSGFISRSTYSWSPTREGNKEVKSFFSGIEKFRLLEDDVIRWDLNKIPGYQTIEENAFGYYRLEKGNAALHIFHANKNALEHTLGVDLIYYNEQHDNFVFVQYKMSEPQGKSHIFRFPNEQLSLEIKKMDAALAVFSGNLLGTAVGAADFRLTNDPFFLKFCPRDKFDPDKYEQIKGMIIPVSMWKLIELDPTLNFSGPADGKILSFENCPRYFDNTEFIAMLSSGWIGSPPEAKDLISQIIRDLATTGKSLIFAARTTKGKDETPAKTRKKAKPKKRRQKRAHSQT